MLRLEMLPAQYGDCLWLEYGEPRGAMHRVLIDGGPHGTYTEALKPRIEALKPADRKFELIVVTHIDNDHIVGILELLQDNTLAFDAKEMWFNGWEQLENIEKLGAKEGVELDQAIKERGFAHNSMFNNHPVGLADGKPCPAIKLDGGLSLTVLSPGPKQLVRLKKEWATAIAEASNKARPEDTLGTKAVDVEALARKPFKSDDAVANGSSIVLLAEYDGHRILLGADSFAPLVGEALDQLGYTEQNRLKLDAYKISHHGSRANNSSDVLKMVKCRNYLFSTSGARFSHPHAECVARVLVHGGRDLTLYSNYPRDDVVWSDRSVRKTYGHTALQPDDKNTGIAFEA